MPTFFAPFPFESRPTNGLQEWLFYVFPKQIWYMRRCLCITFTAHISLANKSQPVILWPTSNTACILRWNVIFGAIRGNMTGKRIISSCYKLEVFPVCSIYSWSGGSSSPAPACCGKTGLTCLTPGQPVSSHHRLTAAIVTLTQMQG